MKKIMSIFLMLMVLGTMFATVSFADEIAVCNDCGGECTMEAYDTMTYEANGDGTHTVKTERWIYRTCGVCGQKYSGYPEDVADVVADCTYAGNKCEACGHEVDLIKNAAYIHSYFGVGGVYDHRVAKPVASFALTKDATIEWVIKIKGSDEVFSSGSGDYTKGSVTLNWNGVNGNGWHPAGTSYDDSGRTQFVLVINAKTVDGVSDAETLNYTYTFSHTIEQHVDYVPPVTDDEPTADDVPPVTDDEPTADDVPTTDDGSNADYYYDDDMPKTGDDSISYAAYMIMLAVACVGYAVTRRPVHSR